VPAKLATRKSDGFILSGKRSHWLAYARVRNDRARSAPAASAISGNRPCLYDPSVTNGYSLGGRQI